VRFILSRHLSQFVTVYDKGSLRSAAEVIGISQPALSKGMKQLEELLDVVLFERTGSGLTPTLFADKLRIRANIILKEAQIAQMELDALKSHISGGIKLSAGPVWLSEIMPNFLGAVYENYPELRVEVVLDRGDFAIPKILNGDLDMYFGAIPSELKEQSLVSINMLHFRVKTYAREHHPIHKIKKSQKVKKMMAYPWSGFSNRDTITQMVSVDLRNRGLEFSGFAYGLDSISALASLGRDTDHIILAVDVVGETFSKYGLKEISPCPIDISFDTGIVCRSSLVYFQPIEFLINQAQEWCSIQS